jgi:hypothetical protein
MIQNKKIKKEFLNILHKYLDPLHINSEDYAIFGSGPLAIRGIRPAKDIDILVTKKVYDWFLRENKETIDEELGKVSIELPYVELFGKHRLIDNIEDIIKSSEIIHGYPFVSLEYLIKVKNELARKKDLKDLKLIETYLK